LTCKNHLPYNLYCVGGDVKHCSLTHSLLICFCEFKLLSMIVDIRNISCYSINIVCILQCELNSRLLSCGWTIVNVLRICITVCHHSFVHFWQAPLGVCSIKHRHQSPEWTILSHVSYFIQGEVVGFQVLLDSLRPCSTRASWWSPPVLQGGAVKILAIVL